MWVRVPHLVPTSIKEDIVEKTYDENVIYLTEEASKRFYELMNNPPKPTQALIDLMKEKGFLDNNECDIIENNSNNK